jgi:tRNA G18 (ribose-2'-O)-methylase SpoU
MAQLRRLHSESAEFQLIEALKHNRNQRHRQGRFFVEGVRAITQAVERGWPVDTILFRRGRLLSVWAKDICARANARVHMEVPPALLDRLSEKDAPSELIAIVGMPPDDLDRIPLREDMLVVVSDRPASPGNLGTLIRSCDALGAHGVIVVGHAADVYDPLAVRASMGSVFGVPVVRLSSPAELEPWLERARSETSALQIVGCAVDGTPVSSHDLTRATVVVLGNEARGISERLRALCEHMVAIPMTGGADSLNVAAAGSIVLYEAARQRREKH